MSSTVQIRFTANTEMVSALKELKKKLRFLSDAEIFKLAFLRLYNEEMNLVDENGFTTQDRQELREALAETDTIGPFEGEAVGDFLDSLKK